VAAPGLIHDLLKNPGYTSVLNGSGTYINQIAGNFQTAPLRSIKRASPRKYPFGVLTEADINAMGNSTRRRRARGRVLFDLNRDYKNNYWFKPTSASSVSSPTVSASKLPIRCTTGFIQQPVGLNLRVVL
jgi:hypothetical protein